MFSHRRSEPRRGAAAERQFDPLSDSAAHVRQPVRSEPSDLERLVISGVGLLSVVRRAAPKRQLQVLGAIPVRMPYRRGDRDADQALRHHLDPGLLSDLPHDPRRWLFPWIENATEQRPFPGIRSHLQKDMVALVDNHSVDPRKPQQVIGPYFFA